MFRRSQTQFSRAQKAKDMTKAKKKEIRPIFITCRFYPISQTLEEFLPQVREAKQRILKYGATIHEEILEGDAYLFVATGFDEPECLEVLGPVEVSDETPKR